MAELPNRDEQSTESPAGSQPEETLLQVVQLAVVSQQLGMSSSTSRCQQVLAHVAMGIQRSTVSQ